MQSNAAATSLVASSTSTIPTIASVATERPKESRNQKKNRKRKELRRLTAAEREEPDNIDKLEVLKARLKRKQTRRIEKKKIVKEVKRTVEELIATIERNEQLSSNDTPEGCTGKLKGRSVKATMRIYAKRKKKNQLKKMMAKRTQRRKSTRIPENAAKAKNKAEIEEKIRNNIEVGLAVGDCPVKKRTVITTNAFKKGEYVCVYSGTYLTDPEEAKKNKETYDEDPEKYGSFVFNGSDRNKTFYIDATCEKTWGTTKGRLINHSKKNPTLKPDIWRVDDRPYLVFFACKDIPEETEILWDYGDHSALSLIKYPWLAD